MFDRLSKFEGNRTRYLTGVNDAHVAAIEQLQPYNGCDWMGYLRDLSNIDRHRNLVVIGHDQMIALGTTLEPVADGQIAHLQMHVELSPTLLIVFGNGLPLIETLETNKSRITQTLDAFNPEFK